MPPPPVAKGRQPETGRGLRSVDDKKSNPLLLFHRLLHLLLNPSYTSLIGCLIVGIDAVLSLLVIQYVKCT